MSPAASGPTSFSTSDAALLAALLGRVAEAANRAGVFASVTVTPSRLDCVAKDAAAEALYRLGWSGGGLWVSLEMTDRWLSHSIEADLLNTGDSAEELIAEEVVEQGFEGATQTPCEHFRSEEKMFTFRSRVPVSLKDANAAEVAAQWLLAYEACFRRLGDMEAKADEE